MDEVPKKLTGKGGAGRGQGRKRLTPDEPTVTSAITMPESYWARLKAMGSGNASENVRKLLDEYEARQ